MSYRAIESATDMSFKTARRVVSNDTVERDDDEVVDAEIVDEPDEPAPPIVALVKSRPRKANTPSARRKTVDPRSGVQSSSTPPAKAYRSSPADSVSIGRP